MLEAFKKWSRQKKGQLKELSRDTLSLFLKSGLGARASLCLSPWWILKQYEGTYRLGLRIFGTSALHSFMRTSEFKFRLTVLYFFENLRLDSSSFVLKLIGCKQCEC